MKIKRLELKSKNLKEQKHFYTNTLGLSLVEDEADFFSVEVGFSLLRFVESEDFKPYHFAFNIPSNQEQEAKDWLKKRVALISDGEQEIIYFDFWDANAIYFYDADQNIVEFISRKLLNINSSESFTIKSVIGISEMGIAVENIKSIYEKLKESSDLKIHSGSVDRFLALGDENGLFIIINTLKKEYWYPTKDRPELADFKIDFESQNKLLCGRFESGQMNIQSI